MGHSVRKVYILAKKASYMLMTLISPDSGQEPLLCYVVIMLFQLCLRIRDKEKKVAKIICTTRWIFHETLTSLEYIVTRVSCLLQHLNIRLPWLHEIESLNRDVKFKRKPLPLLQLYQKSISTLLQNLAEIVRCLACTRIAPFLECHLQRECNKYLTWGRVSATTKERG